MQKRSGTGLSAVDRRTTASAAPFEMYMPVRPVDHCWIKRVATLELRALHHAPRPSHTIDDADLVAVLQVPPDTRQTRRAVRCRAARGRSRGPIPESIRSCGVLKAPPARMTSRDAPGSPARSPTVSLRCGHARGRAARPSGYSTPTARVRVVQQHARHQRVELDGERLWPRAGDLEQPLARAHPLMACRRERCVEQPFGATRHHAPVIGIGMASEQTLQCLFGRVSAPIAASAEVRTDSSSSSSPNVSRGTARSI